MLGHIRWSENVVARAADAERERDALRVRVAELEGVLVRLLSLPPDDAIERQRLISDALGIAALTAKEGEG